LVTVLPFEEEQISDNIFIRTFSADVDEMDLIWHTDKENRFIKVLEGNGWQFQYDEELPFEMTDGLGFPVMKGQIHRVIKGLGPLKIELHKNIL
jgi:hypothetical protein